jgi:hypothetical protein
MSLSEVSVDVLTVMTRRLVSVDDGSLEEATDVLGAGTMEPVNRSREEVVRRPSRDLPFEIVMGVVPDR